MVDGASADAQLVSTALGRVIGVITSRTQLNPLQSAFLARPSICRPSAAWLALSTRLAKFPSPVLAPGELCRDLCASD
jgi:hypothetical protein